MNQQVTFGADSTAGTPSPWDGNFSTLEQVAPATHSEATISVNTRVCFPIEGHGDASAVYQVTLRAGVTMEQISDMLASMAFFQEVLYVNGGSAFDVSAVPGRQVGGEMTKAAAGDNSPYKGPGKWDESANCAYMMATEVALAYTADGEAHVRAFDGEYFNKYGLPMYVTAKKGPGVVSWYGLDEVVARGRPNTRLPLTQPLRVYFYSTTDQEGKVKPIKAIVPFSLMSEDDAAFAPQAPAPGMGAITAKR